MFYVKCSKKIIEFFEFIPSLVCEIGAVLNKGRKGKTCGVELI